MRFHVITLFPETINGYINESILGRAIKEKKISVKFINPRKFVSGKYKKKWPDGNISAQIDERPYGGGPGMVMMAEPIIKAVLSTKTKIIRRFSKSSRFYNTVETLGKDNKGKKTKLKKNSYNPSTKIIIINFIPGATKFTTKEAKKISKKYTDVIMICGRYEGVDARVDKILKTKKYSIGDYVLTGGEIPAMVLIDSISRQVEGVLGNFDSREEERVSNSEIYTRPEIFIHEKKKYRIPKILLTGNHKKIQEWKMKNNRN